MSATGRAGQVPEVEVELSTTPDRFTRADDDYRAKVDYTDQGNANLFVRLAEGNLRFIVETGEWMRWDGYVRPDGEPSRPLTAFNAEMKRVPDAS